MSYLKVSSAERAVGSRFGLKAISRERKDLEIAQQQLSPEEQLSSNSSSLRRISI